jgi:hypothetical protein
MRTLLCLILLGALVSSGCFWKKAAKPGSQPQPRAGAPAAQAETAGVFHPVTVMPERTLAGKVVRVNGPGRFVVLNFPIGSMPPTDQRLNLYRQGQKVGEVKVTGPQQEDNTVADLVAGEAEVGDDARGQ